MQGRKVDTKETKYLRLQCARLLHESILVLFLVYNNETLMRKEKKSKEYVDYK